jgi:flagellar protein FlgJ
MQKKNKNILFIAAALTALFIFKKDKVNPEQKKTVKPANLTPLQFFNKIKPYSQSLSKKIGVPYLFIMAQIALETGFGKSSLFYKFWNVGGIKAKKGQKFVELMTWEYVKDRNKYPNRDKSKDKFISKSNLWKIRVPQNFAIYDNLPAGLVAYSAILQNKYFKKHTFKTTDAKKYARLIQSGRPKYATDINYISKIDKLIDLANKA